MQKKSKNIFALLFNRLYKLGINFLIFLHQTRLKFNYLINSISNKLNNQVEASLLLHLSANP